MASLEFILLPDGALRIVLPSGTQPQEIELPPAETYRLLHFLIGKEMQLEAVIDAASGTPTDTAPLFPKPPPLIPQLSLFKV
jgi:hypothetical protein